MSWLSAVALVVSGTVATLLALLLSAVAVLVLAKTLKRAYRVVFKGHERFGAGAEKMPA